MDSISLPEVNLIIMMAVIALLLINALSNIKRYCWLLSCLAELAATNITQGKWDTVTLSQSLIVCCVSVAFLYV